MAIQSQTKYPQTILQLKPANTKTHWINTNNLKTKSTDLDTNFAQTQKLTESKPGVEPIRMENFNFNIPDYAIIKSITIKYSYRVEAYHQGKYPSIAAPTIRLREVGMGDSTDEKGVTPSKDWKSKSITYDDGTYALPTPKLLNKSSFGIEFVFPKNTTKNEGYVFMNNVSVVIKYIVPRFPVDLVMLGDDNGEFVKDVPFRFQVVVNNPDLAEKPPNVEITVPAGTTSLDFSSITSAASLVKKSDTKYLLKITKWGTEVINLAGFDNASIYGVGGGASLVNQATVGRETGSRILEFTAIVDSSGNKTFNVKETKGNRTRSRTVEFVGQSTPIVDDKDIPVEKAIYAIQNTEFTLPLQVSESMVGSTFYLYTNTAIQINLGNGYTTVTSWATIPAEKFDSTGYYALPCKTSTLGMINVSISDTNTVVPEQSAFIIRVVPEGYDQPRFVVMKLSTEESHRLGDGIKYTITADMKITCLASNVPAFVDYYRNFRLGVVNEIPQTLDVDDIFEACRNWSTGIPTFNEFHEKSVEFTYNENYPVYIIVTSNYDDIVCDLFEGEFGNLQIIESTREDGDRVIFPIPIRDIIDIEDETTSILSLSGGTSSNSMIFYELGVGEAFQNKSNVAVRGVAVKVTANGDSTSIISAQLKSPEGYTGERSVLLDNAPTHIIGGTTDRWGFTVSELANLENFELELSISNVTGDNNTVNIEKVELITYFIFYENQLVDWLVEDENMAGFNVFLQDVIIPEGLKTSTKYLSVDGTDTNDAYRQNIREKEITVEFSIDECSIEESTLTLQDITQVLITERDELYRPIPKKVEFSHYPDIYWEYILEDTIDAEANGSSYDCKVKLTIPAGTAYTKEDTTTGKSGRVAGLAKVNPTIIIIPTAGHIEITETFTEQKFFMTYTDWTNNDTVEIDCKNRKIYLHRDNDTTDISVYADMNTDWFLLYNQFLFEETGCVIQSVTWNERK